MENSFGILVARFRVFEKPIPLSVATTEQIVKTTCALHNWLRKTSTSFQSYVEQEYGLRKLESGKSDTTTMAIIKK